MEGCIEISDGFLINNLYKILYNEYGEGGFKDIFEEICISSNVATTHFADKKKFRFSPEKSKSQKISNSKIPKTKTKGF
jgi:hypothetical protein